MSNGPEKTPEMIRRELERVAELEPSSGRVALAKTTALRALLSLEGSGPERLSGAERHLWDEDRDGAAMVDDRDWHPSPAFAELDNADTVTARRRWWLALARQRGWGHQP